MRYFFFDIQYYHWSKYAPTTHVHLKRWSHGKQQQLTYVFAGLLRLLYRPSEKPTVSSRNLFFNDTVFRKGFLNVCLQYTHYLEGKFVTGMGKESPEWECKNIFPEARGEGAIY